MNCALYARVSTADQHCDSQLTNLRAYADAQGWQIAGEYVDNGISGRKQNRPELDRMLADAKAGKFEVIAVYKIDRLMRSVRHFANLLAELEALNVALVSSTQPIDTRHGAGKLLTNIIAAVAEYEADVIRERVCSGLDAARKRGVRLGRLSVLTDAQKDEIRALHAQGMSHRKIAEQLGHNRMTVLRAINSKERK